MAYDIDLLRQAERQAEESSRQYGIQDLINSIRPRLPTAEDYTGITRQATEPEHLWQRALGALNIPGEAVRRTLQASLGWEPGGSFFEKAKEISPHLSGPLAGLAGFGGFAADALFDPLVAVGMGAGPLYKEASRVAHMIPEIYESRAVGGSISGGALARGLREVRTAPEPASWLGHINEQQVHEHIAPRMLMSKAEEVAAGMFDSVGRPLPQRDAMSQVLDAAFGTGKKDFLERVESYRSSKIAHAFNVEIPKSLLNPEDLDKTLDDLALYQAKLEKGILRDAPQVRLYGIRTGLPSPVHAAMQIGKQVFGNWRPVEVINAPAHGLLAGVETDKSAYNLLEQADPQLQATAARVVPMKMQDRLLGGIKDLLDGDLVKIPDPSKVTIGELDGLMQAFQGNAHSGVIAEEGPLTNFLRHELKFFAAEHMPRVFDAWESFYTALHRAALADKRAVMSVRADKLEGALKTFDKLRGDEKFWKSFAHDVTEETATGAPVLRPINYLMDRFRHDYGQIETHFSPAFQAFEAAKNMAGRDQEVGYLNAMRKLTEAANNVPEDLWNRTFKGWNQLNSARIPFHYGKAYRDSVRNLGITANNAADSFIANFENIESILRGPGTMSGVDLLSHLESDVWKRGIGRVQKFMSENKVKIPEQLEETGVAGLKDTLTRALKTKHAAGSIDDNTLTKANDILEQMAKSPSDFYGISLMMESLSKQKKYMEAQAHLERALGDPLKELVARVRETFHQTYGNEFRRIAETWSGWQAVHDKNRLQELFHGLVAPALEKMQAMVLREHGIGPNIADKFQQYQNTKGLVQQETVKKATEFMLEAGERALPPLKDGVARSRQEYSNLMTGAYKVWDARQAKGQLGTFDPEKRKWMGSRADELEKEGLAELRQIFGSDAEAEEAMQKVIAFTQEHAEALLKEARDAGLMMVGRKTYVPNFIRAPIGHKEDVREFYAELKREDLLGQQPKLITQFFGPSNERLLDTGVELEYEINRVNQIREGKRALPLMLGVEKNLGNIMFNRFYQQKKALAARQMLNDMQTVLPGHVLPVVGPIEKNSKAHGFLTGGGYVSLGDMIPSMQNWWVRKPLYDYIASYAPRGGVDDIHGLGDVFDWIARFQMGIKRLDVTWTPYHLKNIAALAFVGGMDHGLFMKNMLDVMKHPENVIGGTLDKVAHPLKGFALAVEKHKLFDRAQKQGLFGSMGWDLAMPGADVLDARFKPVTGKSLLMSPVDMFKTKAGPFDSLMFDLADRLSRLTLFEQALGAGLTDKAAADYVNHYLVDYSLRGVKPGVKVAGYSLFPFFSWQIGNAMTHLPEMMTNPSKYALVGHAMQNMNAWNSHVREDDQEHLLGAFTAGERDKFGKEVWYNMELPWIPWIKFGRQLTEHPFPVQAMDALRFMENRMWHFPYQVTVDSRARENMAKQLNKEGYLGWLLGTEKAPGPVEEQLWGFYPYYRMAQVWLDPGKWTLPQALANMLSRTERIEPGTGKQVRENDLRWIYDKI